MAGPEPLLSISPRAAAASAMATAETGAAPTQKGLGGFGPSRSSSNVVAPAPMYHAAFRAAPPQPGFGYSLPLAQQPPPPGLMQQQYHLAQHYQQQQAYGALHYQQQQQQYLAAQAGSVGMHAQYQQMQQMQARAQQMQAAQYHSIEAACYVEMNRVQVAKESIVNAYRGEWAKRQARIYSFAANSVRERGGWTAELVRDIAVGQKRKRSNSGGVRGTAGASSVYRGVCWSKAARKWVATITVDGKNVHLGSWSEETDAARSYDAEVRARFPKERMRLNFPDDDVALRQDAGPAGRTAARAAAYARDNAARATSVGASTM